MVSFRRGLDSRESRRIFYVDRLQQPKGDINFGFKADEMKDDAMTTCLSRMNTMVVIMTANKLESLEKKKKTSLLACASTVERGLAMENTGKDESS